MKHFLAILLFSILSSLFANETVKIAVLAFRSKSETLKEWNSTAQYLNQQLPDYTFEIVPLDYPQMRKAVSKGEVQFIVTNSGHYIYLERLYNISRIASMMKKQQGKWLDSFGGVIFTRTDSSLHTINDLKSKTIASVDTHSLGGYVVQMYELYKFGISAENISLNLTGMPHGNVVKAVIAGKADAGFVRTNVLEAMAREGSLDLTQIRVIGKKETKGFPYLLSTDLVPEWPIARMPMTSQDLANHVVIALLGVPKDLSLKEGAMTWTAPLQYRRVHTMYEVLRLPPYDTPQQFNLADVYKRYQIFILFITFLTLALTIEIFREFKLRQKLQHLLEEQTKAQAETKLAAMVYENNSDAIVISDAIAPGHIISVNPAFEKLTGYTLEEVKGRPNNILHSGHHDQSFYDLMWQSIQTTGNWEGEIVDRHKEGKLFSKWMTIRTTYSETAEPYRHITIYSDFTEHKEAQQKIWFQANFDILTSLPNRNMFIYRLEKELHAMERHKRAMVLMFLDLDNFKEINDTMGHDYGDILLQEAAKRISKSVRQNDLVSRLGGDEFTIILPELEDNRVIEKIAQNILLQLVTPFDCKGEKCFVSASIGITIAPYDGTSAEILLKNADQAMYAAKNNGRNQYHYFTSAMQETIDKRRSIINAMRDAVERREFVLHYQPILDLKNNSIHKAEALIRWNSGNGAMSSPADFIPLAEETGMIVEIGSWVFREASDQVTKWRQKFDSTFQISINVSPIQLRNQHPEILNQLHDVLAKGLPSDALVIEITEGLLIEQTDAKNMTLQTFLKEKIALSIDDFGTGYSSLAYLKKFDISFLKIDQSFVKNLEEDEGNKILCSAIITMAHQLGIQVIAEGVETAHQLEHLKSINCDFSQGYYIAKPMASEQFESEILHST